MKEKVVIKRFESGELVTGMEFHAVAQEYFLESVWPPALEEKVTRQRSLGLGEPSDIHYRLVNPIIEEPVLSLEAEHLCRPVNLHRGETRTIPFPTVEQRLVEARSQLERINLHDRA